jgi:integrase
MLSERTASTGRREPTELWIQSPGGGPLRRDNFLRRVLLPAARAAGIPRVTARDLRKVAASLMRDVGAHPQVVQHRMRHSSGKTTSDAYGWTSSESDEAAVAALDALVTGVCGPSAASEPAANAIA